MGAADEASFIELLIASERVQGWVDAISQHNGDLMKLRPVLEEMNAAVVEKEAYAEEARKAGIVPLLTSLMKRSESTGTGTIDEISMDAISSIITACSGPMASATRMRTFLYSGTPVTVKEGALGHGVGAKVWTVAHTFCHELATNPDLVRNRTVLEIGAGCGPCGFLAARLGATNVVLSDYVDQLLLNLRDALHLNELEGELEGGKEGDLEEEEENYEVWDPEEDGGSECSDLDAFFSGGGGGGGGKISGGTRWEVGNAEVRFVDWRDSVEHLNNKQRVEETKKSTEVLEKAAADKGEDTHEGAKISTHYALDGESTSSAAPGLPLDRCFDLVIGTDVLYEWSMAESVAAVIAHRLAPGGVAMICNAVRDQAMFDSMIDKLKERGLQVEVAAVHPRVEDGGVVSSEQEYEGGYVLVTCRKGAGD